MTSRTGGGGGPTFVTKCDEGGGRGNVTSHLPKSCHFKVEGVKMDSGVRWTLVVNNAFTVNMNVRLTPTCT